MESVALAALIAGLLAAAIAAVAGGGPVAGGRDLAGALGRRLACAPRHPVPCNRHPLALAYGFPVGKAVRLLAPTAVALTGPGGEPELPVDFRRCRRPSCAVPGGVPGLTASARRVTIFTRVRSETVEYWLYRPRLGWQGIARVVSRADIERAGALRLRVTDVPALVPLELLPGRNHARFSPAEEPPWRWR